MNFTFYLARDFNGLPKYRIPETSQIPTYLLGKKVVNCSTPYSFTARTHVCLIPLWTSTSQVFILRTDMDTLNLLHRESCTQQNCIIAEQTKIM